ncbi:hypothetical protein SB751_29805, partial [Cupriavidus sp. SIMBA_020]|uniref:hypothetical protein n=1 Tax=Cupriavidus sp. SIMBA_020 TaxID=3085766 RepID=UPI00397AF5A2
RASRQVSSVLPELPFAEMIRSDFMVHRPQPHPRSMNLRKKRTRGAKEADRGLNGGSLHQRQKAEKPADAGFLRMRLGTPRRRTDIELRGR